MGTGMERLPDAELEVMQGLWRLGVYPAASAEIMEAVAGRQWKLATLIKLLSRLEKRGFVGREKEGRGNLYRPLVGREVYLAQESRSFLERLHGGSVPSLVAALVEGRDIAPEELAELEGLLEGPSPAHPAGDGGRP